MHGGRDPAQAATGAADTQAPLHSNGTHVFLPHTWAEADEQGPSQLDSGSTQYTGQQETTGIHGAEKKAEDDISWPCFQTAQAGTLLASLLCRRAQGCSAPLETLASSSILSLAHGLGLPGRCTHSMSRQALAGQAPSAVVAATKAREVKAPGVDGHSLSTQDAANSSGGGGSHSGVLREGAEDGSGQGHHHGRWFNNHTGVLALPEAGLVAAVGKRSRATGTAQIVAGHGCGTEVYLGERAQKAQAAREKQPHCLLGK